MCHLPVPRTASHAVVPFFGLERCGDKCRPEQKPEAQNGFQTNKIESVDAVVCCRVGVGSRVDWSSSAFFDTQFWEGTDTWSVSGRRWLLLLWEALCSFSSRSVLVLPLLLLCYQNYLLKARAPSLSGFLGVMVCLVLCGTGHYQGHVFTYKQQMGEVSCHHTQVQQVLHLKLLCCC